MPGPVTCVLGASPLLGRQYERASAGDELSALTVVQPGCGRPDRASRCDMQVVVELVEGHLDALVPWVVAEIGSNRGEVAGGRLDEVPVSGNVREVRISDTDARKHQQGRSHREQQAGDEELFAHVGLTPFQ